jgi:hypothetical protein
MLAKVSQVRRIGTDQPASKRMMHDHEEQRPEADAQAKHERQQPRIRELLSAVVFDGKADDEPEPRSARRQWQSDASARSGTGTESERRGRVWVVANS